MAIQTRNSVLAIKVESTEGTPVAPAGASDYTAIQDDLSITPQFELQDNAELKGSIGMSKKILGVESPTASFSHYIRHSGTEGVAPDYNELLKAGLGTETVISTEGACVASSTVSLIKGNANFGAYARGQAVLVKHTNAAYEIMPILSMSTNDAVPAFNLDNAPANTVLLGKPVTYSPANSGHQTLSLWHYVGNGGAVQLMSGSRVTELGMTFTAGELINGSFSLEGISYYFNPIVIGATDRYLDFTDDDGTHAAVIAAGTYKDPHELAAAIQTAMDTLTSETITVTYSDTTGKYTIATTTSSVLTLLWNTGTNAANTVGDKLGFSVAADSSAALSYTAATAKSWASPYTPSVDSADPLSAKDNKLMIGDATDNACFAASSFEVTISTPKTDIMSICALSGKRGSVINSREVTATVTALLDQNDVSKFHRFHENQQTSLAYVFGTKSGGNWVAGKCGCLYMPTCTISSFSLTDSDGLVTLEMELTGYVDNSGNGEIYLSFV